jgi:hypothetical protein
METRYLARWTGGCTRAVVLSALAALASADATPVRADGAVREPRLLESED